jgi:hypothetical protein
LPTTTTTSSSNATTQNIPSNLQQDLWGGIVGAGTGLIWPNGNFLQTPEYPGGGAGLTAPMSPAMLAYLKQAGGLPGMNPDYSGVMGNANVMAQQASAGIANPNDINFNGGYQNQQFNVNPFSMTDPFAGYNGGGPGMQVQPGQGVGGTAADYQTKVDQVQAPQGVGYDRISGLPQISGPNLQQYQMGPAQQVQAPGGLSSYQIAAAPMAVQTGTVGTQSWTQPGTAQQYMSPYTQQVLDAQKANVNADYAAQQVQSHAQAAQAGAFGGSRQAVQDAENQRNQNLQLQNIEAQGLQGAYQQGAQQFNTEQGLGMQSQQFNVQTGMQAGLANQQAQMQTALANQQAALAAQGLGTNTNMQAQLANQQAGLTVGGQNLQSYLQTQGLGANLGQQAQIANQQMAYNQQLANQQAGINTGEFNNQQQMQASLANQGANLQAGLNATNLGAQGAQFNASQQMQAQLANQQAQQAQYQRQYGAMTTQYGGNLQAGLQTQNLGMTAQQLAMQSAQYGAGLNLQSQVAQQQARNAQQGMNLGYLNFEGTQNQNIGNWQTQGFNNQMATTGAMGQAAGMQQGYDQSAADRAYQYWQYQQNYPFQSVDWLANLATKLPAQGSTTTAQQGVNYQNTPNPSIWNTLIGGLATVAGGAAKGFASGRKGGLAAIDTAKAPRLRRPNYTAGLTAYRKAA